MPVISPSAPTISAAIARPLDELSSAAGVAAGVAVAAGADVSSVLAAAAVTATVGAGE